MSNSAPVQTVPASQINATTRGGVAAGAGAYLAWGFLPLYFLMLDRVFPLEIVASRIIWSLFLLLVILALRGTLANFFQLLKNKQVMLILAATSTLIASNWLVYIWAVHSNHVVAASLGYFLNPLVNVLLGFAVLKERLNRLQWTAVALAAIGVAMMAVSALDTLWISLTLAVSFSLYGLIRKMAPVTPLQGLAAETLILAPFSLAYMGWLAAAGSLAFGTGPMITGLLLLSGVITSVPLLLFAVAAKRMAYSTLGLLQYITPTLQFMLGLLVFGETLTSGQLGSFGLIWAGLALYSTSSLHQALSNEALPGIE